MAKKSLILSNNDGKITFSDTGSLSVDDITNNISASYVSASSLRLPGVNSSGIKLLSASNGVISTFPNGAINNSGIAWNGTRWVTSSIIPQYYTGIAGGDLSGSYDDNVTVTSIENVYYGALPVNHGGTGTSLEVGVNDIVKVSSSAGSTPQFSTITAASGSILTSVSGVLSADLPWYMPKVEIYTKPGTYNWKKPDGIRFARVITQGAGGSGGNGARNTATWTPGGGGAGGGFADSIFELSSISNATVTVGAGGAQQKGTIAGGTAIAGNAGGGSSFVSTGINIYGNGGAAGGAASTVVAAAAGGGAGGAFVAKTGGSSNSYNVINSVYDAPAGGGVGESYLGTVGTAGVQNSATINRIVSSSGLFGYNYNTIDNVVPQMTANGGTGADPTATQPDFYNDPTVLLHMKPFYEKTVDVDEHDKSIQIIYPLNGARFTSDPSKKYFGEYAISPTETSTIGSMIVATGQNIGTGDFTWESWVYLNNSGSNKDPVGMRGYFVDTRVGSVNTNARYALTLHDNAKIGLYVGGSGTMLATSNLSVPLNQWSHIALVRKGGVASFYINGTKDTVTANWNVSLSDTANGISIGSHAMGVTNLPINGYLDNIRLSNIDRYTATFTPPTASFQADNNTLLLINDNYVKSGISNTYLPTISSYDSSAGWATDYAPFAGGTSLHPWKYSINNSCNTGSATVTPGFSLSLSDFTWESWVYFNDNSVGYLVDTRNGTASANKFAIYKGNTINNKLHFYAGTGASPLLSSSLNPASNSWQHIALVRASGVLRFYINGEQDINTYSTALNLSDATNIRFGNSSVTSQLMYSINGYMSDIRLSNIARYTSNYTVPTASFVKDDNTILLINGPEYDNAITNQTVDSSYHGRQVTFNGAANLTQSLTAFGDTAYVLSPMSTTNRTGSITVSPGENLGTRDFTVESWVYLNSTGSNQTGLNSTRMYMYDTRNNASSISAHLIAFLVGGKVGIALGNGTDFFLTSSYGIPTGSWNHIALTRQNNTFKFYINGLENNFITNTQTFQDSTRYILGGSGMSAETQYSLDGYIDEFRITPKALYTASFTPSTTRFSDPYNPILLLHMDPLSGSANKTLDSSKSKNDIYFAGVQTQAAAPSIANTVGNPFNEYGNSILLSGSATSSPALTVVGAPTTRTEPFTFECWVYRVANSIEPCIFDSRLAPTGASGWYLGILPSTGQLRFYSNGTYQYLSNLSIPLNRWTHVALVRNGTNSNTSVYINGVRDTKNLTLSSTFNFTDSRFVLGAPFNAQNQTLYGYMDEVRLSKGALYTGSVIATPIAPFPDPTGFQYSTIATGSSGIYGSGGGGGGNTLSHLQELSRAYLGGKGGDGYVAIISW